MHSMASEETGMRKLAPIVACLRKPRVWIESQKYAKLTNEKRSNCTMPVKKQTSIEKLKPGACHFTMAGARLFSYSSRRFVISSRAACRYGWYELSALLRP